MMQTIRYFSRADVERVGLSMAEVITRVEQAFVEKGQGRVEMPPKPGIHPQPNAFIHAMPAYIPALRAAGVKWVSGFPANEERGLPYISGLLILNDVETGLPSAVMDCTWITAQRTGAATAVAAKYLARRDATTVAIIGCGVQGRSNLEALAVTMPRLRQVFAYDSRPANQARYIAEMASKTGLHIAGTRSAEEAVRQADIVVTAGPILQNPTGVIEPAWLKPGIFAAPVDFDSYWKPAACAAMDKIATDDLPQLDYYRSTGHYFQSLPTPYAELAEIVIGKKPGRERPEENTMAMNLGVALEDMAVAAAVYERACAQGLGVELPL
jgi:ornithine cyclodeaminase/alanine dehydrogenase-like protein (mu-crystallin family)